MIKNLAAESLLELLLRLELTRDFKIVFLKIVSLYYREAGLDAERLNQNHLLLKLNRKEGRSGAEVQQIPAQNILSEEKYPLLIRQQHHLRVPQYLQLRQGHPSQEIIQNLQLPSSIQLSVVRTLHFHIAPFAKNSSPCRRHIKFIWKAKNTKRRFQLWKRKKDVEIKATLAFFAPIKDPGVIRNS